MLNRYVLLDLETVAADDCRQWLGPIEADPKLLADLDAPIKADSRLVDPVKIAADLNKKQAYRDELPGRIAEDIRERTEAAIERAAIDADLCKIVCIGLVPSHAEGSVSLCLTDEDERRNLERTWAYCNASTPMVGYGLTWFDLGVLVRRSQLLNVLVPSWVYKQGKYRHDHVIELADYLTLNGMIDQKKGRGLEYHCQRFGINIPDDFTGKDVAALWAEGAHDAIVSHCLADLQRVRALAERLGVISVASIMDAAEWNVNDPEMVL